MKVGYVRVSSLNQKIDRQLAGLESLGLAHVYSDKVSGSALFGTRPNGERLLADVASGLFTEVHSNP